MAVLVVLFLAACISIGVVRTKSAYGTVHFNTNAILSPATAGMEVIVGPVAVTEPRMELLLHPWHPRPQDCPDAFSFVWELASVEDNQAIASGRIDANCEAYREDPESPPVARVPLGDRRGTYWVKIRPDGLSDFPDIEIYLIQMSLAREIGYVLAWCFGSVFLALFAVALYRHRKEVAAAMR